MKGKFGILSAGVLLLIVGCAPAPAASEPSAAPIPVSGSTPDSVSATAVPASPAPTIQAVVSGGATCFELLTPASNAELPAVGKINFTWQAMPDAARYILEITTPDGNVIPFTTGDTQLTRYAEATARGGVYQWKVTAYNVSDQSLCTAGPLSYSKPASSQPAKKKSDSTPSSQCPPPPGCQIWDPVACVCNG